MQWDAGTIALVLTGIATLGGTIAQVVQFFLQSKTENKRVDVESSRVSTDSVAQSAQAMQALSSASESLLNRYVSELGSCQDRIGGMEEEIQGLRQEQMMTKAQIKSLLDILAAQMNSAQGTDPCDVCILKTAVFQNMLDQIRSSIGE